MISNEEKSCFSPKKSGIICVLDRVVCETGVVSV